MLERNYHFVSIRDGRVLCTGLHRGRFRNQTHFINLLEAWTKRNGPIDYYYSPAPATDFDSTLTVLDFTTIGTHLA